MMTYIRSTSTYCKYSRKRYDYRYGMMGVTNYYQVLHRTRYLFIKSNALHIYYVNILNKNYFSYFQEGVERGFLYKGMLLKIIDFYLRFEN